MTTKRLALIVRDFTGINYNISHKGLDVSCKNIALVLRSNGYHVDTYSLGSDLDIQPMLRKAQASDKPYSHVVIGALWVRTGVISELARNFPEIVWAVNCHSNVGFLQSEPAAIALIRDQIPLQYDRRNFHMAGNSDKLVNFVTRGYMQPFILLPNMYALDKYTTTRDYYKQGDPLHIGMLGAFRVQKNFQTGAAAAIVLGKMYGVPVEISVNVGRNDGGEAGRLHRALNELTKDLDGVTLRNVPWKTWDEFKEDMMHYDLLMTPSYSETFNIVTCDGIARGVPSVVSQAIDWAPNTWKADSDDVEDIVRVADRVLRSPGTVKSGLQALMKHNRLALESWSAFLGPLGDSPTA